ncbi:MAG: hypothetical protein DMG67_05230 [Acidobacteria bacterium]|nr:MAG: hypothetical protein DMG67_05230 [Acidobacteriota bacterium]
MKSILQCKRLLLEDGRRANKQVNLGGSALTFSPVGQGYDLQNTQNWQRMEGWLEWGSGEFAPAVHLLLRQREFPAEEHR